MDIVRAKAKEAKLQKAKEKKEISLRLKEGKINTIYEIDGNFWFRQKREVLPTRN